MKVTVSVSLEDADSAERQLRSLNEWLLADTACRRHARPALGPGAVAVPGAQGGLVEVLNLVLGTGFNAASLALAIASWRRSRPQRTTLVVERADGTRVTLTGGTDEDAGRLLAELERDQT
ncbi:effector-associated constant component EACC1 [Streptomyces sp. DSM 40750]|uniref:effector-associated constant component EACC1 n=1 Tax=Streptomyces sp. DSM 40750 TaxID=2801030 RepID=UPI00214B5DD6|nr:hypothetical protein [Streptomyces sp. DSM 40750]UUU18960.1 hypothetical protein JIX55_00570 [Streptomyces sp. DSM 40750]UUU27698.1 hypothetical protein JIX55_50180 [Streptomyces sp. DSM 40750]